MLGRVGGEVEVEPRDRRLHDAPHRLPEVGHEAHQLERTALIGTDRSEVRLEERLAPLRVELVVDREVRKVEEHVAHPGVLPVDDAHPLPVVDEVGVQEVVVARPLGRRTPLLLDPTGELA